MRIYLIGFMTSGKSCFGHDLAQACNMEFLDCDELFEEKYRITILDFFDKYGEGLFRKLERDILMETLQHENAVIATGGGLPCFFDNMEVILKSGVSIYLRMSGRDLATRIRVIKKQRPLLKEIPSSGLEDYISHLLKEREPFYEKADHIFNGPEYPLQEIMEIVCPMP